MRPPRARSGCCFPSLASAGRLRCLLSRSPQRRGDPEQLGVRFEVVPADVDELTHGRPAERGGAQNALRRRGAAERRTSVVLGVDTEVFLDGALFGKPRDEAEARRYLERLSGRTHEVFSGARPRPRRPSASGVARTAVTFRTLDAALIDWYLATGEWRDRAGAYAIQGHGAALVARVDGDYWNVVGLPCHCCSHGPVAAAESESDLATAKLPATSRALVRAI